MLGHQTFPTNTPPSNQHFNLPTNTSPSNQHSTFQPTLQPSNQHFNLPTNTPPFQQALHHNNLPSNTPSKQPSNQGWVVLASHVTHNWFVAKNLDHNALYSFVVRVRTPLLIGPPTQPTQPIRTKGLQSNFLCLQILFSNFV